MEAKISFAVITYIYMQESTYTEFPCDICGSSDAVEIPHVRDYTGGQPIHICTKCGFVYVQQRRSAEAIAEVWSEEIFGAGYTAAIPAVRARLGCSMRVQGRHCQRGRPLRQRTRPC